MNISITTLREQLLSTIDSTTSGTAAQRQVQLPGTTEPADASKATAVKSAQLLPDIADSVDLSVSNDVFKAVDNFFNLGRSGRFEAFHDLSPADKEQFVKIVAELAKAGYAGFEELIVNHKKERHEVTNQIANDRLRLARVYDNSKEPHR